MTMLIVTVCAAATLQLQVEAKILQEERRISWSGAGCPGDIPFVLDQVNVLDSVTIPALERLLAGEPIPTVNGST
jgi:hypothetical protein